MTILSRPFAVVTGASSGIGYELAYCRAEHGFDLLVAADEPAIHVAADAFRALGSFGRGQHYSGGHARRGASQKGRAWLCPGLTGRTGDSPERKP